MQLFLLKFSYILHILSRQEECPADMIGNGKGHSYRAGPLLRYLVYSPLFFALRGGIVAKKNFKEKIKRQQIVLTSHQDKTIPQPNLKMQPLVN